jgi:hypothetical protein
MDEASARVDARPLRIPLAWPRWLHATRLSFVLLAITAATTTALLTAWIPAEGWLRVAIVALGTLTSIPLASWASAAENPGRALGRSLGAGALQAFFASAVLLPAFVALKEHFQIGHVGTFLAFAITAAILSVPVGGIIGLAYSVLPMISARSRVQPSHGDVDRVLLLGGGWLVAVAAAHTLLTAAFFIPFEPTSREQILLGVVSMVPIVLGMTLLAIAAIRAVLRARFLSRVHGGKSARFRIALRTGHDESPEVLPLVHGVARAECSRVLVRIGQPAPEVLYRDAATPEVSEEAVALLP